MKIAFILDPLKTLDPDWDTSLALLRECRRRGFSVLTLTPQDLFWDRGRVWGDFSRRPLPLSLLDAVWMRKDPPVNAAYLDACRLLALVPPPTVVLNAPQTLLAKNEKLFALEFPRFIPETRVAASPRLLGDFLKRRRGKMVMKPLHERGGRGVRLVTAPLRAKKPGDFVEAQAFLPQALAEGNKRVLFVDGRVLGCFLRLPVPGLLSGKPIRGEKEAPARLTPSEKKICAAIGPVLRRLGLFFVGIDLIGEKLVEINITSPAGIPELNALYGGRHEKKVIDVLIRKFFRDRR